MIRRHPEYGLDFVGFVGAPPRNLPGPLLGDVDRLDDIITTQGVRRVLVAFGCGGNRDTGKRSRMGRVAAELGNTPAVVYRFYRELVRPADAAKWFSILPQRGANVVALRSAAEA